MVNRQRLMGFALSGYGFHCLFDLLRPHPAHKDKTPIETAGVKAPSRNWKGTVKGQQKTKGCNTVF
jgi:hypothetical protein